MSQATVLSRVLGYVRDMTAASLFGASWVSDAFVVAFRIPNLFRDLFAEGALSSALVPALSKAQLKGQARAWELASQMINAVLLLLGTAILVGILAAPWVLSLAAPGFRARPEQWALALRLTRLLFPFVGFMSLAAVLMGLLNTRRRFGLPALAPALMNAVMISFGLLVCPRLGPDPQVQVAGWAWGALLGGAAQMLVQVPPLWREGFRWRPAWPFRDAGVLAVLKQMGPAVLGQSTTQVNLVVNTILASQLGAGAVTYLYYGNRLMQLPLGVFGVAIATAVLPELAAQHSRGEAAHFRATLSYGLRLTLYITLPAMAGLIALAEPINILLLNYGRFDVAAAQATAKASVLYTLGVVFASWSKILVPAFYALELGSAAVRVSMAMVALNLALNLALIGRFQHLGLAASASITAAVQALSLLWLLRGRVGPLFDAAVRAEAWRMAMSAAGMVAVLVLGHAWLDARFGGGLFTGQAGRGPLALATFGLIAAGAASYLGFTRMAGMGHFVSRGRASGASVEREVANAATRPYDEP